MTTPDAGTGRWPWLQRPAIGRWGWTALAVVSVTVLYCDVSRFRNPEGERYLFFWHGGQIDFSYPYLGARALLAGVNPYVHDRPEFTHPVFKPELVGGVPYKQLYPPGSFVTLVPLALVFGEDWQAAARVWFHISLVSIVVLSLFAWWLVGRITKEPPSFSFLLVLLFALTLEPGAAFALERGQGELFAAALCWGAVLLCLRGSYGSAIFLAVWATTLKGYAVLFAAGLAVVTLDRQAWKATLMGGTLAAAVMVLPCAAHLDNAWQAAQSRAALFQFQWYNHSFRHIAYRLLGPALANTGKMALLCVALAATLLSAILAVRAFRHGDVGARALWLTSLATVSLGTVVGASDQSVAYNFPLLTPGLLVLAAAQEQWAAALLNWRARRAALGVVIVAVWWLCFVHRLGGQGPYLGFPAAGLGLALFMVLALGVAAATLLRRAGATAEFTAVPPL